MFWIGIIGGLLVATGFVAQIIKTLRIRWTTDLSTWMLLIIFVGGLFYTTCAIQIGNPIFIAMNGLATTNTTILLLFKLRFH